MLVILMFGPPGGFFLLVAAIAAFQGEWGLAVDTLLAWLGFCAVLIGTNLLTMSFMYAFNIRNVRTNAEREWELGRPQRESRRRFNEFMRKNQATQGTEKGRG